MMPEQGCPTGVNAEQTAPQYAPSTQSVSVAQLSPTGIFGPQVNVPRFAREVGRARHIDAAGNWLAPPASPDPPSDPPRPPAPELPQPMSAATDPRHQTIRAQRTPHCIRQAGPINRRAGCSFSLPRPASRSCGFTMSKIQPLLK